MVPITTLNFRIINQCADVLHSEIISHRKWINVLTRINLHEWMNRFTVFWFSLRCIFTSSSRDLWTNEEGTVSRVLSLDLCKIRDRWSGSKSDTDLKHETVCIVKQFLVRFRASLLHAPLLSSHRAMNHKTIFQSNIWLGPSNPMKTSVVNRTRFISSSLAHFQCRQCCAPRKISHSFDRSSIFHNLFRFFSSRWGALHVIKRQSQCLCGGDRFSRSISNWGFNYFQPGFEDV